MHWVVFHFWLISFPSHGLLDQLVIVFLVACFLLLNSILLCTMAGLISVPTNSSQGFPFPTSLQYLSSFVTWPLKTLLSSFKNHLKMEVRIVVASPECSSEDWMRPCGLNPACDMWRRRRRRKHTESKGVGEKNILQIREPPEPASWAALWLPCGWEGETVCRRRKCSPRTSDVCQLEFVLLEPGLNPWLRWLAEALHLWLVTCYNGWLSSVYTSN